MTTEKLPAVGMIDNLQQIELFNANEKYTSTSARFSSALGGNSGNIAFVDGARSVIENPIVRIGWGWSPEVVKQRVSRIIICCANQLGAHADLGGWASRLEAFGLPVALIGLGAQTTNYESLVDIPEGTRRFLRVVNELRSGPGTNIGVRGVFTQQVLKEVGFDSSVVGCPSLFLNPITNLGSMIAGKSGTLDKIAVAAGNPFHRASQGVERLLVQIAMEKAGAYIVQHPDSMIALALGEPINDVSKLKLISNFLGFEEVTDCQDWLRKNSLIFSDSQTWRYFLQHYDGVLGPRYHGIALGVQVGIPGLVIHIDNRTKELATTTGIKSISASEVSDLSADELTALINWSDKDGSNFDVNRCDLAIRTTAFLEQNEISPSAQLRRLATP